MLNWGALSRLRDAPVDIQDSDERVLLDVGVQGLIDVIHDPVEELGVYVLSQGVSRVNGLELGNRFDICFCCRLQLLVTEPVGHVLVGHPHQLTECCQMAVIGLGREDHTGSHESASSRELLHRPAHCSTSDQLSSYTEMHHQCCRLL